MTARSNKSAVSSGSVDLVIGGRGLTSADLRALNPKEALGDTVLPGLLNAGSIST
jgi:hypothetical protein